MSLIEGELWQAYSEQGEPTRAITKDEARLGILHGAAHVWMYRYNDSHEIEILLQKRAADKLTWPEHMDISAAGHIDSGETPIVAALRETKEEIGLDIDRADLTLFMVHRASLKSMHGTSEIIENEFQWVYLLHLKDPNHQIHLVDGEVESIAWMSLDSFRNIIAEKTDQQIVPHGELYFQSLLEAIRKYV